MLESDPSAAAVREAAVEPSRPHQTTARTPAAVIAFIAVFLAAHAALAVTCYFRDAKTWGWQMFAHATFYRVELLERSAAVPAWRPVPEAAARAALSPRAFDFYFFAAGAPPRNFHRGRGLLLDGAAGLPAALCRQRRDAATVAIAVRIEHRDVSEPVARVDSFQAACP